MRKLRPDKIKLLVSGCSTQTRVKRFKSKFLLLSPQHSDGTLFFPNKA